MGSRPDPVTTDDDARTFRPAMTLSAGLKLGEVNILDS